ncbi:hypothetical protein [Lactobacillus kefiranofaciens]|uniref:hypothetical protein n=1 Tax=Lactobacillus kefiranofaciens TaxID=267818 RepID=UPI001179CF3E|nr:hypothetical protein [Lactobacillus kefiranofaciens]MCP9330916.1 hypothetical protein [Lactobacillus kefiranofaciens]
MAKNRKLAKQLNQRKIYLFFSKSSMKKHRKNKAFVLLNPTFKDIIGYQTSYDTSNLSTTLLTRKQETLNA